MNLGIEAERAVFKAEHPNLYSYIVAHELSYALSAAGDAASGAVDGRRAANRIWRMAGMWRARADRLFADSVKD